VGGVKILLFQRKNVYYWNHKPFNVKLFNHTSMDESTMKKHVTLVAALQIGFSSLSLLGSVILFFVFAFAGSFVEDVDVANTVLAFVGTILPAILMCVALAGLIGGIGLLSYQKWARVLVMVVAALGCLSFPLGTLKGVYSIWVLMQDETVKLFS
jgi:hypothetical protein